MFNNSSKTDKVSSYIVFEESRDKFCDKYPRLLVLSINTSPESCESSFVNILKRDINLLVGEMVKTKNGNLEFALDDKKKKIKGF